MNGHTCRRPLTARQDCTDCPGDSRARLFLTVRTESIRTVLSVCQRTDTTAWWTLRPDPELLRAQPGRDDPHSYVGAIRSVSGELAMLHLPCGGEVGLAMDRVETVDTFRWYDPRRGAFRDASHDTWHFTAPDGQDLILLLTKGP